jgi:hypothetical protein
VSAEFAAMAALASRARCVLGERKRLASGIGVVAWRTWLAEGAEGIYPHALCVPASPSDFRLGEVEESNEWEEGDEGRPRPSASESGRGPHVGDVGVRLLLARSVGNVAGRRPHDFAGPALLASVRTRVCALAGLGRGQAGWGN